MEGNRQVVFNKTEPKHEHDPQPPARMMVIWVKVGGRYGGCKVRMGRGMEEPWCGFFPFPFRASVRSRGQRVWDMKKTLGPREKIEWARG
jgi:hypothetical protein